MADFLANICIIYPAVVAWFIKASVFHSVNYAPSANGGSNPAWVWYITNQLRLQLLHVIILNYRSFKSLSWAISNTILK